jgi:hypothetical protein
MINKTIKSYIIENNEESRRSMSDSDVIDEEDVLSDSEDENNYDRYNYLSERSSR